MERLLEGGMVGNEGWGWEAPGEEPPSPAAGGIRKAWRRKLTRLAHGVPAQFLWRNIYIN